MNIIAIMPSYRPKEYFDHIGGGEISNRILLEGLAARGHKVTVLTWNAGGAGNDIRQRVQVCEFGIGYRGGLSRFATLAQFSALSRNYLKTVDKPDILLCGTEGLGVALRLTKIAAVPVGLFVRAFENFERPQNVRHYLNIFTKTVLLGIHGPRGVAKATFLLPNSKFMEEYCFAQLGKKMPSAVIYPPLNWKRCLPFQVAPIRRIAMVGTSEKKGIKLAEYLAHKFTHVEFRVLGVREFTQGSCSLPENLKLLGWSNIQEEFSYRADAVIVPSLWEEPFGRVAIEALACGKPPLVANIGGLPEAVCHESLLCLPPGDAEAWGEGVGQLIGNPSPFVEAAMKAAKSLNKFSAEQQIENLEQGLQLAMQRSRVPDNQFNPLGR